MQPRSYNHHHHHHMSGAASNTGSPCYPTQNYPNYYGNMDYLPNAMSHHSQLVSTAPTLNHMTGSGNMSSHMSSVMNSHGLHHSTGQTLVPRSSPLNGGLPGSNDCLDYKPEPSSWTSKFQVL